MCVCVCVRSQHRAARQETGYYLYIYELRIYFIYVSLIHTEIQYE